MKVNPIYYLLFVAPVAVAETGKDYFTADISVSSQLTDNAQKQFVESIRVDERQDLYQFAFSGAYSNEWIVANTHYSLAEQRFSENSQPAYTSLVGGFDLDVGANSQPAHLKVSHSSENLLNAPDALDFTNNRDERSILTTEPSLRWRMTAADTFVIGARVSEINYKEHSEKDSSLRGVQIVWQREISKIDSVKLAAMSSRTSFDIDSTLDYRLDTLLATYSAKLSHLEYDISVGANSVFQEAQSLDFTRPSMDIDFKYTAGSNTFNINVNRHISDSSSGSGQPLGFESAGSSASGVGLDLIDVTSASVSWSTDIFCDSCMLNLSSAKNKENYEVLIEDSVENVVNMSFSYRLVRSGTVILSFWQRERSFDSSSIREDISNKNIEVRYRHTFSNKVSLDAFAKKYQRDSANKFSSYDENVTGIRLAYSF
ncbi:hypothetical protein GCM10011613_28890 [Cellvibrio zantedeschiae]|uniref:TIGR03016 family PEP-CTERM system-associated outer membrane protein n=1 Tax=Cellvibrio zantedeschiae TaxID=1237077 RepID=A0ABQ3B7J8_9GAMM|nr:hypothetical protein [Cellvibrio zantedeschiae]GGY82343.1 hypothetical protein GCM10011613_28890 [Cellvibrio zantedeschiae]